MQSWVPVKDAERLAVAVYPFLGSGPHQIPFSIGDTLHILQRCGAWYFGYATKNRAFRGIFPCLFVRIKRCIVDKSLKTSGTVIARENPLLHEVTSVLREWGHLWKQLYVTSDPALKPVSDMLHDLIRQRRKIIAGTLPTDELRQLKRQVTSTIDRGNELLKLDLVVRDEQGNILNPDLTSAVKLYRHHKQAASRSQHTEGEGGSKRTQQHNSHCLYVTVQNCVFRLDEDAEIILFLCDGSDPTRLKILTEPYVVAWKDEMEKNIDQMRSLRVLYTDLSNADIASERIFLVGYVVKVGSTSKNEANAGRRSMQVPHKPAKKLLELCRRPVGAAAIGLSSTFSGSNGDEDGKHRFLPFLPCSDKDSLEDAARRLIRDVSGRDSKGQGLWVTLKLLHGEKEQHPHLAMMALSRRLGFPDVILPTDVRNDLYLTLLGGEFTRGNKVQDRNVEVTVKVCNPDGTVRHGVIERGAGCPPVEEYRSVVYWHESRPRWAETVKVVLPIEGDCDSHVRFTFKHRSNNEVKDKTEKPFGLAYVRLLQADGTTLRNTRHELNVYKINPKNYEEGDIGYLSLPSLKLDVRDGQRPDCSPYLLSLRDSFSLESVTCSTKLTQDVDLLGLLKWSSDPGSLKDRLGRLDRIKQEELVKFLRDSLDALFHILINYETDDTYDIDVFNALVTIISSVTTERRYQHFQPVLEAYLQSAFSATIVDRKLMGVLQTYLDDIRNPESRLHLLKALGCLRYVFKFIIKSRQLYIKMNGSRDTASFEQTMQCLLRSFTGLMLSRDAELESVQEAVLQHLPAAVDDLNTVCDPIQLSETMAELVRTLASGNLTEHKLTVISRLVHSQLFLRHDCRRALLPEVVSAVGLMFDLQQQNGAGGMATLRQRNKRNQKLAYLLGEGRTEAGDLGLDKGRDELQRSRDELQLCIEILSDVLDVLWRQHGQRGGTSIDVGVITVELLRKVIQTVISVDREDPLVCGLVAVLISMLRQMEKHHYDQYMSTFTDVTDQLHFITEVLMVFRDQMAKCVYPPLWCEMVMLQNSVILKSLRLFSYTIRDRFLEPFEHQIWNNFFHCAISFLTQSPLQLENFSASKRSRLLSRYKDMRKATAQEILTMWISLGQHKIWFVPSLVGPFLEMTLVPDPELRALTIPLFFDMMQCEFYSPIQPGAQYNDTRRRASASKCNFREFEHEMINKLDHLVEGGRGDDYYRELFREKMLEHCEEHKSMREQGVQFVNTVTDLMKRLLEYRAIMRDENEENKMSCTVNLLHFYYDINCQEMYIRYLYKLCGLHLNANNYIEAGFTLKLHADQLQWSDEHLPSVLRHTSNFGPLETHRAMKEALYNRIIEYFDSGKLWEAALQLCKELSGQYEEATFDYHQLSQLLQRMSRLYDKILKEIRPVPAYFRVAFYGRGFPAFLQNKVYVYRGRGYERLAEFSSRVQGTFPKAELMDTLEAPGPEVTESLQQHVTPVLQINSVDPDMEDSKRFSGKPVTEKIVQYYRVNDVDRFVYSRRSQRGAKDPDNPFASMWLQRTVMRTSSKLPGILAWFPVTATETYDVTPLENAIETMTTKNRQLRELILSNRSDAALPLNPLTQTLSGIISPAVMGGTANYETFFSPEYLESNPGDAPLVAKLKVSIAKQIPLLEAGLETHGQRAPDNLKPLQSMLEETFDRMRTEVQDKFGVQECDLPYHRPVVPLRHHRPSLAGWDRQDSSMSDLSPVALAHPQNGAPPFRSLMNLSQSFSSGGTLKSQKSNASLPRSKTIFYSQSSSLSCASSSMATPVRGREKRDSRRGSTTSQLSDASTIILSEELQPVRPLRSEVERERRLTRPCSGQYSLRHSPSTSTLSSRDSIGLNMDEDLEPPPPPLPVKQNRSMSIPVEPDCQDVRSSLPPEPLTSSDGAPTPPPKPSLIPSEGTPTPPPKPPLTHSAPLGESGV